MTPARKRNLWRAPVVLLVRVPLLFPFWALYHVGQCAEQIGGWIGEHLPTFEREHDAVRRPRVFRHDPNTGGWDDGGRHS